MVNRNAVRFPKMLVGAHRGWTAHVADAAGRESWAAARSWRRAQAVDPLGDGSHDPGNPPAGFPLARASQKKNEGSFKTTHVFSLSRRPYLQLKLKNKRVV